MAGLRMGGAHLPPVALWVAEVLCNHFPPQVTQWERSSWSSVEGVCPYTLKLDSHFSKIKPVLTESTSEASPRSEHVGLCA